MDYSGYNGRVVFSLDTEWCCDTHQNPNGQVTWSGLPELMQIGYYHDGIRAKAWLIPLTKISKKIPSTLLTFLTDARFEFCGIQVSNDVKQLEKKFKTPLNIKTVSLGMMTKDHAVVTSAVVSLKNLSQAVLKKDLSKDMLIRCSKWSEARLCTSNSDFSMSQRTYAALDVIVPLEIFWVLKELPNLNCRLTWEDAKAGTMIDVFPSTGAISALSVSAIGTIKSVNPGDTWIVPPGPNTKQTKRTVSSSNDTVIVTVFKVFARGLKVPRVTKILDNSSI
jgi:hypothetical protein